MYARDEDQESPLVGQTLSGKWRVDARLGAGGMATVYAATHRNGNRVAIKLLRSSFARDPEVRARFLREGYVSNSVGHPGAVKVLDDDSSEGSVFLVMELLEGESLEARRSRLGGRLPIDEVFTVADKLLDVLTAAHRRGIVHRDVKPENVFVTEKGEVKVLDFGVAQMRHAGGDKTGVGLMLGTPDFMAPEQMGGHPDEIDGRADLWSVGATLFFLLSGQQVHQATNFRDHIIATSTRQARSLLLAAPTVPLQLVDVVDRALQLEKHDRWPDAETMQTALRRAYAAISLARTSPRPSMIPDMGAEDLVDPEKTQAHDMQPWFGSDAPPPPGPATAPPPAAPPRSRPEPASVDRTLAMPPISEVGDSERTIALPTDVTEMAPYPVQVPREAPSPAPRKSPSAFVPSSSASSSSASSPSPQGGVALNGVMRTERLSNIVQLAAQVQARLSLNAPSSGANAAPPASGRASLPQIDVAPHADARLEGAAGAAAATRQRLLILAIVLVAAIVLAFAARLAFELREPSTTPAGPAPSAAAVTPPPPAVPPPTSSAAPSWLGAAPTAPATDTTPTASAPTSAVPAPVAAPRRPWPRQEPRRSAPIASPPADDGNAGSSAASPAVSASATTTTTPTTSTGTATPAPTLAPPARSTFTPAPWPASSGAPAD